MTAATSTRHILIEHNGKKYTGHIATIESTSLGYESHGILTAMLHCKWRSGGVGVGGFFLDQPKNKDARDYTRVGTAYGLDHIIRIIETVGVDCWEDLKGSSVLVLFEGENVSGLGSMSRGIAGLHNDKVLILQEHADEWRDQAGAK